MRRTSQYWSLDGSVANLGHSVLRTELRGLRFISLLHLIAVYTFYFKVTQSSLQSMLFLALPQPSSFVIRQLQQLSLFILKLPSLSPLSSKASTGNMQFHYLELLEKLFVGLQPDRQSNQSSNNSHRTSIENGWAVAGDTVVLSTSRIEDISSNRCALKISSAIQDRGRHT